MTTSLPLKVLRINDDKTMLWGLSEFLLHLFTYSNICYANQEGIKIKRTFRMFSDNDMINQKVNDFIKRCDEIKLKLRRKSSPRR